MGEQPSNDKQRRMWGGRFTGNTDALVQEFGASVDVDRRMALEDLEGSVAHAVHAEI